MNGFDVALLALVLAFAGIGALRGALAEGLAALTWIGSLAIAWFFYDDVSIWFADTLKEPLLRQAGGFVLLFAASFVTLVIISFVLRKFVFVIPLSGGMRAGGALLGAARGVIVVMALVLVAGLMRFPQAPWWRESTLAPHAEWLAQRVVQRLPAEVARHIRYQ